MAHRPVVILAFPGVQSLDVVGPFEVFSGVAGALGLCGRRGGYDVTLASVGGGPVRAESGLELGTAPLPPRSTPPDTLVIPGGNGAQTARHDPALREWITTV